MTGTWAFLRHFLRRDRWHFFWWGIGVTLLYWSQGVSVDSIYATQEEFDRAAASMEGNAALVAMTGPARALNTVGGQVVWQASAFGAICVGLMSMFLVGRHTRTEEETGRDELLRAAPVGRHATMTAALLVALLANLWVGFLVALSLVTYPLEAADSWAVGVGLTLTGWAFTGVALLAAQLTSSARATYGMTGAAIGLAYGLRAIGDVGYPVLTWLSPIGWYQGMHPFSGLRWWPGLLLLAGAAVAVWASYGVFARRDFGAGVLAARPGPARAGRGLRSGWGLAWQLQRGTLVGWASGMLLLGLAYGSLGVDVEDMIGESESTRDMMVQASGDLVESFYATSLLMIALIAAGFAVSSALRPRQEEDAGRVEALLGTALSRRRWLLGHVGVTVLGTVAVVAAGGLGVDLGYAGVTGDWGAVGHYLAAALPYAVPVLALAALTRLLYGVAPRTASLAWLWLGFAAVVMLFGELFQLPQWLQNLSPFEHLPLIPAEELVWGPVLGVALVTVALSAVGQVAFLRRDVH